MLALPAEGGLLSFALDHGSRRAASRSCLQSASEQQRRQRGRKKG
jgi:hypothetical protein